MYFEIQDVCGKLLFLKIVCNSDWKGIKTFLKRHSFSRQAKEGTTDSTIYLSLILVICDKVSRNLCHFLTHLSKLSKMIIFQKTPFITRMENNMRLLILCSSVLLCTPKSKIFKTLCLF